MIPKFWKLSHGPNYFSYKEILDAMNSRLCYVHKNTQAKGTLFDSQASKFINAPIGDYFYLTHGNQGVYLLGQFTGPANVFSEYGDGWLDRPYRLIKSSISSSVYGGPQKWWTPNDNSTFTEVPETDLNLFQDYILEPFFGIKYSDFDLRF